jgi:hypothetical protein
MNLEEDLAGGLSIRAWIRQPPGVELLMRRILIKPAETITRRMKNEANTGSERFQHWCNHNNSEDFQRRAHLDAVVEREHTAGYMCTERLRNSCCSSEMFRSL